MYVLEAKGIMKTFPGVKALQDVDFALEPQEIHALMGENGAGKSTLVKVLTGVYQADGGTITIGDKVLQRIETTKQAFDLGISVIHQELNLLPHLDVATNIYIGRLPKTALGLVDWKKVHADADEVLRQVAADFDSHDIVRDLSVSQQQLVEIAKSVSRKAKILFFDEPTSSLTPAEVQNLFRIMRNLKEQGITMVYISSTVAIKGVANRAVYSASKGAVLSLSRSMAAEYVREGVRVNCVCPGTIETPSFHDRVSASADPEKAMEDFIARQPMGRLGTPEEIAQAILFAASPDVTFMTGANIVVDGAMTL